jgi:PAS domain S-box-containing protein
MRLGTRILLLFLTLSLGPLLVVFLLAYQNGRRAIEQSLGQLFELRAQAATSALDRELVTIEATGRAWAALELMQDALGDDVDGRVTTFLMAQGGTQPLLAAARVTNVSGTVVAASRPEWVGEAFALPAHGQGGCQDVPSAAEGGAIVACRYPIRASFDETRTVGGLELSWDLAQLFRQESARRSLGVDPAELVLLRRDGSVALAPPRWRTVLARDPGLRGSQAAALAARGERGYVRESVDGNEHLIGFDRSRGVSGWSALVMQDAVVAFAPVNRMRLLVTGIGTVIALSVAALSVFVARRLTGPLLEIDAAARRVAAGDLGVRLEPRSRDELGSLAASFDSMVQDLREQHAQRVDKEYLDSLLASMVDGLLVIDPAGRVERVNPGLLGLLGCEAVEVVGRRAAELFAEGLDGLEARVLEPARRAGSVREVEMQLVGRDGGRIPVSLSAGVLPAGTTPAPVVCIASDERRRKSIEQALEQARAAAEASSRAKDGFLATISHEIRTPLHGILGVIELIARKRLGPAPQEYLENLQRSAEALLAVVNQVLDFSKLDVGKVELERAEFDLRDCVASVADVLGPRAREKDLELVARVDAALPSRVVGDESRLRQVLLNLGSNAITFTRRGEVVIRAEPLGTARVQFAVSDTGVGISQADRERLFQPFSQLDQSSTRRAGGTGLGLAISRQLVRLMGGEIEVDSEPNHGSTFRFAIELETAAQQPPPPAGSALAGRRVLVVDDNATNRFVAREMLSGWGASVSDASDGWEALELLRTGAESGAAFDLAIVDFQMPEMDGGQLVSQIRGDPRLGSLPVVMLTSVPLHGEAVRSMRGGLDGCLTKPVRESVLRDTLAAVLHQRRAASRGARAPGSRPALVLIVDPDELAARRGREAFERAGCSVALARGRAEALELAAEAPPSAVLVAAALPDASDLAHDLRRRDGAAGVHTVVVAFGEGAGAAAATQFDRVVPGVLDEDAVRAVLSLTLPA